MSDLEIEKAAMGPRRWFQLCSTYEKQEYENLNDPAIILCPRTSRSIDHLIPELVYGSTASFLVPGGRYLVCSSFDNISVLDLGYTSTADCKLIASVALESKSEDFKVHTTSDGMGLAIYSSSQ